MNGYSTLLEFSRIKVRTSQIVLSSQIRLPRLLIFFLELGKIFIREEALFEPLHRLKIALSAGTACPQHSGVAKILLPIIKQLTAESLAKEAARPMKGLVTKDALPPAQHHWFGTSASCASCHATRQLIGGS